MAEKDYSATPLPKKLGIAEGSRVAFVNAPDGLERILGELPAGAVIFRQARRPLDVAVVFCTKRSDLQRRIGALAKAMAPAGRLWVAWPKKASKMPTDLTFELVQGIGLEQGLVDNKSAAIDDVWQGLQFVYRLKDRPRA